MIGAALNAALIELRLPLGAAWAYAHVHPHIVDDAAYVTELEADLCTKVADLTGLDRTDVAVLRLPATYLAAAHARARKREPWIPDPPPGQTGYGALVAFAHPPLP